MEGAGGEGANRGDGFALRAHCDVLEAVAVEVRAVGGGRNRGAQPHASAEEEAGAAVRPHQLGVGEAVAVEVAHRRVREALVGADREVAVERVGEVERAVAAVEVERDPADKSDHVVDLIVVEVADVQRGERLDLVDDGEMGTNVGTVTLPPSAVSTWM